MAFLAERFRSLAHINHALVPASGGRYRGQKPPRYCPKLTLVFLDVPPATMSELRVPWSDPWICYGYN